MNSNHTSYCLSVAIKVKLIYGELTFTNAVKLLTATGLNATPHLTGISIQRFAAMVIQSTTDHATVFETD